jgi:hypothetical protein
MMRLGWRDRSGRLDLGVEWRDTGPSTVWGVVELGTPASPAAHKFARPFGLTDNPFAPMRLPLLNGTQPTVQNKLLLSNLHKLPLRLDKDWALDCLFVPEAGKFGKYQQEFQNMLELAGYGEDPVETVRQFAFLVRGEQGTGKSTLVNMLVHWLRQCRVPGEWYECRYPPEPPNPQGNQGLHDYLADQLSRAGDGSYCSLVIDGLTALNKDEAIRVYEEYIGSRVLVMFMITDDLDLLGETRENDRIDLNRFRMEPLTPDQALAFVRRRIDQFRVNRLRPILADYPLFPFAEEDVLQEVAGNRNGGGSEHGSITLRSFATILQRTLAENWQTRQHDPGLETLTPEQLASRIIKPAQAYARLVAA